MNMTTARVASAAVVRPATLRRARPSPRGAVPARVPAVASRLRCNASADGKNSPADVEVLMFKWALDEATAKRAVLGAGSAAAPLLMVAQEAFAKGGELGILEGRTGALIHPAIMFFLFFATSYTGYLGYQWRRVREIGEEISVVKATIPATADVAAAPSEAETKVAELTKQRKELVAGGFKDKHFNWGSLLLGLGVAIAVEGPINTYIRTGKLFPGPHLYAGAAITVLWAAAAAMVPAMQKGNDTARSVHIGLNCLNLALFAWQVPTGIEIVLKVFQFTSWP